MNELNKSPCMSPEGEAVSTTTKVPPAKLARVVEWIRHYLYRLHQRLTPAPTTRIRSDRVDGTFETGISFAERP